MNRQTDNHEADKPKSKPSDHGDLSENPRPEGPDHDAPDDVVIEKTLPKKIPIGPNDV